MPVEYQVMIIYAVTKKYVIDVAVDRILDFQKGLFELIDTKYPQIPETIRTTKVLDEETEKRLLQNLVNLQNKTCMIITHKKAALSICNKEVCIEDKKIIVKEN